MVCWIVLDLMIFNDIFIIFYHMKWSNSSIKDIRSFFHIWVHYFSTEPNSGEISSFYTTYLWHRFIQTGIARRSRRWPLLFTRRWLWTATQWRWTRCRCGSASTAHRWDLYVFQHSVLYLCKENKKKIKEWKFSVNLTYNLKS
jgi:hypothetical protein